MGTCEYGGQARGPGPWLSFASVALESMTLSSLCLSEQKKLDFRVLWWEVQENNYLIMSHHFRSPAGLPLWNSHRRLHYNIFLWAEDKDLASSDIFSASLRMHNISSLLPWGVSCVALEAKAMNKGKASINPRGLLPARSVRTCWVTLPQPPYPAAPSQDGRLQKGYPHWHAETRQQALLFKEERSHWGPRN